jgi:hypothetical protein
VKTNSSWREVLILLAILAIIALITGLIITTYRGNVPSVQSPQSTVLGANAAYPATPDPEARQTAAALFTQNIQELNYNNMIISTNMCAFCVLPETIPPTGTFVDVYTLATGQKYYGINVTNSWFGLVNGESIGIIAGSEPDDPSQGVINFNPDAIIHIRTPGKDGAVLVASEFNNRLVLVAEDGTVFYFDIPARRFVSSLTEWVPTQTATPTSLPYPTPPPPNTEPPRPYPLPTTATFEPYVPYPTPGG